MTVKHLMGQLALRDECAQQLKAERDALREERDHFKMAWQAQVDSLCDMEKRYDALRQARGEGGMSEPEEIRDASCKAAKDAPPGLWGARRFDYVLHRCAAAEQERDALRQRLDAVNLDTIKEAIETVWNRWSWEPMMRDRSMPSELRQEMALAVLRLARGEE